mgnify:FL=1
MNINWKVRLHNPTWWAQVVCAVVLPLVCGVGAQWTEMTTWTTLGRTLLSALGNPVVVVAMLVQLWTAVTDPTTKGTGDSAQALTYETPKED